MMSRPLLECPYHPKSKFALDVFLSHLHQLKAMHYETKEYDDGYIISVEQLTLKKLEKLFNAIDHRYHFLDRMRSLRDYEIVLSYDQSKKIRQYFKRIDQFELSNMDNCFTLARLSPYFLTNHSLGKINLDSRNNLVSIIWDVRRFRFLSISNDGKYSIIKSKSKYILCENANRKLHNLDALSIDKNYVFIFNSTDNNFASIDQDGKFTYYSVSNQPLIKINLDIDSYLSIKHIHESKYIITDEAIYNFSGDKVHSGSDKYVFHYFDDEIMVRENLFSQKLEIVDNNNQISRYEIYHDRLIYRVRTVHNELLIVIYEDELLDIINIVTKEKISVFTPEKIQAISIFKDNLLILLSSNILQIAKLNIESSS